MVLSTTRTDIPKYLGHKTNEILSRTIWRIIFFRNVSVQYSNVLSSEVVQERKDVFGVVFSTLDRRLFVDQSFASFGPLTARFGASLQVPFWSAWSSHKFQTLSTCQVALEVFTVLLAYSKLKVDKVLFARMLTNASSSALLQNNALLACWLYITTTAPQTYENNKAVPIISHMELLVQGSRLFFARQ